MDPHKRGVLAIGLDAAEPSLVKRLVEKGEMPFLGSLLAEGTWLSVKSPAHIGSGCVWPTFASGTQPLLHGIYGEWCWQPQTMDLKHFTGGDFQPFWKALSAKTRVGTLDVPFVKPIGLTEGFEVVDWGPHDPLGHRTQAQPASIGEFLRKRSEPHPLAVDRHDNASTDDPPELAEMSASCS